MKLAVFFPGIGYHCDRPLLYYSAKIAAQAGYECIRLSYTGLDRDIPSAFKAACAQTEASLADVRWDSYDEILFVSKSIGTAVAAAHARHHQICCRNVYLTPLGLTFDFSPQPGIAFHGTADTWVTTALVRSGCQEHRLPLHIIKDAGHSLERADDAWGDIKTLEEVMALIRDYITKGISYRTICADEICRELFCGFIRHQDVVRCWRRENGAWVIKDDPFIDDWSEPDYAFLISCLKNTADTGGFVYAAFCDGLLKGFVSVEPDLFGGAQGYLDLSSIHVSEDMRHKGIGKMLFLAAKRWAREKGAKKLYISAHSAVETQDFYSAMGCAAAQVPDQHHMEAEPFDCQLECVL